MERLAKKCSPFASTSTLHLSSRPKAIQLSLKSPKENKQLSPSGQKRSRETSEHEEDSFSASTKKPNVEKELEKHVFWHHENCHSCKALQRIEEKHMARLQHHFKFCDVYSVYYRTIKSVAAIIQLPERINPEIHFLHQEQAKEIWTLASNQMKSKENPQLFECAVEMSSQFLGPAETATFNCDEFKKHLELLLDIAQFICLKFKNRNKEQVQELIGDIETYLKPFRHQDQAKETVMTGLRSITAKIKKWDETFLHLRHSPEDNNFGNNLKDIADPKPGQECIFFPEEYQFKCHGQK